MKVAIRFIKCLASIRTVSASLGLTAAIFLYGLSAAPACAQDLTDSERLRIFIAAKSEVTNDFKRYIDNEGFKHIDEPTQGYLINAQNHLEQLSADHFEEILAFDDRFFSKEHLRTFILAYICISKSASNVDSQKTFEMTSDVLLWNYRINDGWTPSVQ